jgi:transcriptional regulator NrdR family protein
MNENKEAEKPVESSIEKEMEITIQNNDLSIINEDLLEFGLDFFLEEGVLRDLPVIGAISGVYKFGKSIHTAHFTKKIVNFLFELKSTTIEERNEFVKKVEEESGYVENVGEQLILIIEKTDNFYKAKLLGKLLTASVKNHITYQEFLYLAHMVNNNHLQHIRALKNTYKDGKYFIHRLSEFEIASLIRGGIMKSYNEAEDYKEQIQKSGKATLGNKASVLHKEAWSKKITKEGHLILNLGF